RAIMHKLTRRDMKVLEGFVVGSGKTWPKLNLPFSRGAFKFVASQFGLGEFAHAAKKSCVQKNRSLDEHFRGGYTMYNQRIRKSYRRGRHEKSPRFHIDRAACCHRHHRRADCLL